MKISVIVPVYNVENYLEKCLDSLVNQTIDDYEIIVVNDGSPDDSQLIIDKFARKYPKLIKSYKKENGGLSDARNYGISKASGEYISFVDSDDYVNSNMLLKMYNKAVIDDFDIVVCDINSVYSEVTKVTPSLIDYDLYDKEKIKKMMLDVYPSAWNKIYKRSLFENGVFFKQGVWYEDVEFFYRLVPYISKVGVVKEPLINYVRHEGAITSTFNAKLYDYIDNWNGILNFYKEKGFYDEYKKELEYCYVRYLYSTFVIQATNFKKKEYNQAVRMAKKNVKKHFPRYRRNSYFYTSLRGIYMISLCMITKNMVYYGKSLIKKIFLKQ